MHFDILQPQFIVLPILFASLSAVAILLGMIALIGSFKRTATYTRHERVFVPPTPEQRLSMNYYTTKLVEVTEKRRLYDSYGWIVSAIVGAIVAALMGLSWLLAAVPLQPKYWAEYTITGTVSIETNHKTGAYIGDQNEDYIVHIGDSPIPLYVGYDERITALVGQTATLVCFPNWHNYGNSADWYDCTIQHADFVNDQP